MFLFSLFLSLIILFIFPLLGAGFGLSALVSMLLGRKSLWFHRLYCIFSIIWWLAALMLISKGSISGSSMGGIELIDEYYQRVQGAYALGLIAFFYSILILIFFRKKLRNERKAITYHGILIIIFLASGSIELTNPGIRTALNKQSIGFRIKGVPLEKRPIYRQAPWCQALDQGDSEEAWRMVQKSFQEDPNCFHSYELAKLLLIRSQTEEAMDRILSLPHSQEFIQCRSYTLRFALLLERNGKQEMALKLYDTILKEDPVSWYSSRYAGLNKALIEFRKLLKAGFNQEAGSKADEVLARLEKEKLIDITGSFTTLSSLDLRQMLALEKSLEKTKESRVLSEMISKSTVFEQDQIKSGWSNVETLSDCGLINLLGGIRRKP